MIHSSTTSGVIYITFNTTSSGFTGLIPEPTRKKPKKQKPRKKKRHSKYGRVVEP